MELISLGSIIGLVVCVFLVGTLILSLLCRRVVETNEVHIVQSAKKTTSYGKDTGNGNVYYEFPSWIPILGITTIKLPTSVFDLDLDSYEAYDQGRLPFVVDVKAFFRITDSNLSAQRVSSLSELLEQLRAIVQGAVRVILATNEIEEILQGRATFGDQFTLEVKEQLTQWGVSTVKNIELMDIRDSKDSQVINNIMKKKKSQIEMESRVEVAENIKKAKTAEIDAQQEIDLRSQEATQSVGIRTVEAEREVALKMELKNQQVLEQKKTTKEREMETLKVQEVKKAQIAKEVSVVQAQQDKEVLLVEAEASKQSKIVRSQGEKESKIITSEGDKDSLILQADGKLQAKKKESEGIKLEGMAKADAEQAMQVASIQSQIELAKEIGSNEPYQQYLITIRKIEADQAIGMEQAKALDKADIKIINSSGTPMEGIKSVGGLFTPQGGIQIGSMLESLSNTDTGKDLINKFLKGKDKGEKIVEDLLKTVIKK